MRVLLVENNSAVAATLAGYLIAGGNHVEITNTGVDALELLRHYDFDIVLLNLTLPDTEGSIVIHRARSAQKHVPILALSEGLSPQPRMKALAAGADDVVARTIDQAELVARMGAIVRRSRGYSQPVLCLGALTLNLEQHKVTVAGNEVSLTGKEFAILQLLMLRKNMVMTKEAILGHLYGGRDEPEPKIVDVFVCKIRKKLAAAGAPDVLGTVWGRGYTIRDDGRASNTPQAPQVPMPMQRRLPSTLMPV